jgi:hypothetical protein
VTIVVVEKTINVTYFECVFATLDIQHAMGMRQIVICSALKYFSYSLINGTIFEKKKKDIEHKMQVLIFSTVLSEIFIVLSYQKYI